MSKMHLKDLPPLEDGIELLAPMLNKMDPDTKVLGDEWEWEDDAYSNPCKGIIIALVASSVFWVGVYLMILWFQA